MGTTRRFVLAGLCAAAAACGSSNNDPPPRVIAGGGVGDGAIDDLLNVYVIDTFSEEPLAGATVEVGSTDVMTDATGLAVFHGLHGAQTVAVKAANYRSAVWADIDGANVTMALTPLATTVNEVALAGSINNWDSITVPSGHVKAAAVTYSQTSKIGAPDNSITTPGMMNLCGIVGTTCNFTVDTRVGTITLIAAIIDRDTSAATNTIIGWAWKSGIVTQAGVNQSGITLDLVEAGNLENPTIDLGTPPAGLTMTSTAILIESGQELIPLPIGLSVTMPPTPKASMFDPGAGYKLEAVATASAAADSAQSIVLRHSTTDALSAGTWLSSPTSVTATLDSATFSPVTGAKAHSVQWIDSQANVVLEITLFDTTKTTAEVPSLLALPAGTYTVKAQGIGADFDVTNFSLDTDVDQLWGISAQPVTGVM